MCTFYLGTHQPGWLRHATVPLFVSHRRLASYRAFPEAAHDWALDSGGFSELAMFGEWRTSPESYVASVRRYDAEIGSLSWAAPQDWMCEPFMLARTGLNVTAHQHRTVESFVRLRKLWYSETDNESPFMPVLQGWRAEDYLHCCDLYGAAGVDLAAFPLVGVGSVCRRQATGEIGQIMAAIRERDPGIPLHGFGVKLRGLEMYGHHLESADSMAWSYDARRARPLPGCQHKNCANCLRYALAWREEALAAIERGNAQPTLWAAS